MLFFLASLISDINAVDENPKSSRTALIHAARNGHIEAMLYRMRVGCPWRDLPLRDGHKM